MNSRQRRGVILLLLSVLCAFGAFAACSRRPGSDGTIRRGTAPTRSTRTSGSDDHQNPPWATPTRPAPSPPCSATHDAEPATPVGDSTQLIDTLARLAGEALDELPEVVLVHERIGRSPPWS
ncbi:hypothetical protein SMICM17S_04966 [Streptomyces microflavus]